MTTTAALLDNLNTARSFVGKAPLKSWKASRTALEQAIEVAMIAVADAGGNEVATKADAATAQIEAQNADQAPKATKKSKAKAKAKAVVADTNTITAVELAKQLNMTPKALRAKLRRIADKVPANARATKTSFHKKHVAAVVALIETDLRKKS